MPAIDYSYAPETPRGGREEGWGHPALLGAVAIVAMFTRFIGAGLWSLHGDELASVIETLTPQQDPFRLASLMPLGYLPARLSLGLLGPTHWGIRLGSAACGAASIGIAAWGVRRVFGGRTALALTVMLGCSPWHLYFSQFGRFHGPAFLCATVFLVALSIGFQEERKRVLWVAAAAGGMLPYAHSHLAFLLAATVIALFALTLTDPTRPRLLNFRMVAGMSAAMFLAILPWIVIALRMPAAGEAGNDGSYGPAHTLAGVLNYVSPPVMALAAAGGACALLVGTWKERVVLAAGFGAPLAMILLSAGSGLRPDNVFPASIAIYLLAALAVARAARAGDGAWGLAMLAAVAGQAPGLISYFSCGNRFPVQQAVQSIETSRKPGETVYSEVSGVVRYYGIPEERAAPLRALDLTAPAPSAGWVIQLVRRRSEEGELDAWLRKNARLAEEIQPRRFDYFEMETRIWRVEGN